MILTGNIEYGNVAASDCLVVDVGSRDRSIFIPANLLNVLPGNFYRHVLLGAQQSSMINFACRPAKTTKSSIGNYDLITNSGVPMLGISAQRLLNGSVIAEVQLEEIDADTTSSTIVSDLMSICKCSGSRAAT